MDKTEARLVANVAKIQKYVDVYLAIFNSPKKKLTAKQERALAINLDTLAKNQRALAAYQASYHEPAVEAYALPAEPIPNKGVITQTYGCPDDFDPKAFEERYGFTIEVAMSRVATGLLRPNLDRWQSLVKSSAGNFDQAAADHMKRGEVTKQKAMIAFFAGEGHFPAEYFGGWIHHLGCADLTQLQDFGQSFVDGYK